MSVEFTIEGLNARQRFLADIIWACDTKDRVDAFIKSLPTKALRNEARSIVDLMVMAVVEQCYDGVNPDMSQAKDLLSKYNNKKA